MRRLHPKMTPLIYAEVKNSPIFLKNNAYVCEGCFMNMTRHSKVAGNTIEYIVQKHEAEVHVMGNAVKNRAYMMHLQRFNKDYHKQ